MSLNTIECSSVLNQKITPKKEYFKKGYIPMKKEELSEKFHPNKCNVAVSRSILQEYSKNKYQVLGQVFKRNQGMPWPPMHIFLNWVLSGDAPEISDEFNRIQAAKSMMLQADIIDDYSDDEDEYLRKDDGSYWLNEKGEPIQRQLRIKQKNERNKYLMELDRMSNPFTGKLRQQEVEQKNQVSSVDMLAQAFVKAMNGKLERTEQEVNQDFIDHDKQ